jgi:hypothetical protein
MQQRRLPRRLTLLKKKRKKVCRATYSSYIYKGVYTYNQKGDLFTILLVALKQVHPDTGISNKATCTDQLYSLLPLLGNLLSPLPLRPLLKLLTVLKQQTRLPRRLSLLKVKRRREERSTGKLTALTSPKVCIPKTIKETCLQSCFNSTQTSSP